MTMQSCNVLGVGVSAVNLGTAAETILGWVARREAGYVCVTGVHGVMESWRNPDLRRIHNTAALVVPDGMPLVWLSWFHRLQGVGRVYGPDLMLEVCRHPEGIAARHFLYGGGEGVADRLAARLRDLIPGLRIVGTYTPPFRPLTDEEDAEIVGTINRSGADIVWVGLSTPKQERWMAQHLGRITAPVMIGVGAAFDFHAGLKRQAPLWMQRSGLEWSFRLVTEPRRLWRRYLINNPMFVTLTMVQLLGLRTFRVEDDGVAP
jgi:N-acetylglucosaminyldiphosphoundecaprenol N-acetyl-beta-D-mannosaminyltransferase